jgi:hypothetical protein
MAPRPHNQPENSGASTRYVIDHDTGIETLKLAVYGAERSIQTAGMPYDELSR